VADGRVRADDAEHLGHLLRIVLEGCEGAGVTLGFDVSRGTHGLDGLGNLRRLDEPVALTATDLPLLVEVVLEALVAVELVEPAVAGGGERGAERLIRSFH
jgi:hypothetical protein